MARFWVWSLELKKKKYTIWIIIKQKAKSHFFSQVPLSKGNYCWYLLCWEVLSEEQIIYRCGMRWQVYPLTQKLPTVSCLFSKFRKGDLEEQCDECVSLDVLCVFLELIHQNLNVRCCLMHRWVQRAVSTFHSICFHSMCLQPWGTKLLPADKMPHKQVDKGRKHMAKCAHVVKGTYHLKPSF